MSDLRKQLHEHYDARALSPEKVEGILARGRAAAAGESGAEAANIAQFPIRRRKPYGWMMALAATLLLFAGIAGFWRHEAAKAPFAAVAPRIIDFFAHQPDLKKAPQDKEELHAWQVARGAPAGFHIPASLMPLESVACDVVDVQGRKTYLSCFWREQRPDRGDHELIHLLVGRRSDFRGAPPVSQTERRELNGWSFASWSDGSIVYTLAVAAPPEKLTPFLAVDDRPEVVALLK